MPEYRLTPDAEADLAAIARYKVVTWGPEQAKRYQKALERGFKAVAEGAGRYTSPLPHRPDVRCLRCQHHYIFSVHEDGEAAAIVAILHENMDLPTRLRDRLQGEGGSSVAK